MYQNSHRCKKRGWKEGTLSNLHNKRNKGEKIMMYTFSFAEIRENTEINQNVGGKNMMYELNTEEIKENTEVAQDDEKTTRYTFDDDEIKELKKKCEDIARTICNPYIDKSSFDMNIDLVHYADCVACTYANQILINLTSRLYDNVKTKEEAEQVTFGVLLHELGHVLFTPTDLIEDNINSLLASEESVDLPEDIDKLVVGEIKEYASKNEYFYRELHTNIHKLYNLLEDIYLENRLLNTLPTDLSDYLAFSREQDKPTLTEIDDVLTEKETKFYKQFNLLLRIAKYNFQGELTEEQKKAPAIQIVLGLTPLIEEMLCCDDCSQRIYYAIALFTKLWPLYKQDLDNLLKIRSGLANDVIRKIDNSSHRGEYAKKMTDISAYMEEFLNQPYQS